MAAWLTPDDPMVTELWPDAPTDSADDILATAQGECEAFSGKTFDTPESVPAGYRVALVMHARAIHRAMTAGGGDQLGADGFTVTVYPMDRQVKMRLRPPHPVRRLT